MSEPHGLYRFWSPDGTLLYIGITNSLPARIGQHSDQKPWWREVAKITVQHFDSRDAVLAAEREAIRAESPKYNIHHNARAGFDANRECAASSGLIRVGDCVALGLNSGECPVGLVKYVDDRGIRLRLLDFLIGEFSTPRVVLWSEIIECRHADLYSKSELRSKGWCDEEASRPTFRTDPLGTFQTNWNRTRLPKFTCPECKQGKYVNVRQYNDMCASCEATRRLRL